MEPVDALGDFATRATIWLAIAGYGTSLIWIRQRQPDSVSVARYVWSLGCLFFAAHVLLAFGFFYAWSHAVGLAETARQTAELTGIARGEGLYLNYSFGIVWIMDCVWWWTAGDTKYQRRPVWVSVSVHGYMAFMIFNGAVVFGSGPVRWFGLLLTAAIGISWFRSRSRAS